MIQRGDISVPVFSGLFTQGGVNGTAAIVQVIKRVKVKGGKGTLVSQPGDFIAVFINDLIAISGSIGVAQVTSPWIVSGSGTFDVSDRTSRVLGSITTISNITGISSTGNSGTVTGNNSYSSILKSAVIKTDGTAGTRSLFIGGAAVSTKTVAPSSAFSELLDREVAWSANTNLTINNGAAGDVFSLTWVRLS